MGINEFIDAVKSEVMKFPNAEEKFFFAGQWDPETEFGPCVELLLESRILNVYARMWIRQEDIDSADPKIIAESMRNTMARNMVITRTTARPFGSTEYF